MTKITFSNGKVNKTQMIYEFLITGITDPPEIKKRLDFMCGDNTKMNYIIKKKCVLMQKIKGTAIKNTIALLPKTKKEAIKEAMEDAILHICEKAKGIKADEHIKDLFSDILHLGNR